VTGQQINCLLDGKTVSVSHLAEGIYIFGPDDRWKADEVQGRKALNRKSGH
jgi:hypothetical protein